MSDAQPMLIPDCAAPGGAGVSPAATLSPCHLVTLSPRSRGRGATPKLVKTVTLPTPNPAGRTKLTFDFRPLKGWEEGQLDHALALVVYYFAKLAGFRKATDKIVRAFYGGLEDCSADEIRWAIDAKASSLVGQTPAETRAKRMFVGQPETFFERIGYWLEQSPQYQARLDRQRRMESDRRLEAVRAERVARERATRAGLEAEIADRQAERAAQRRSAREQAEARRLAYWDSLSDRQKMAARKAVETGFSERCRSWGENPQDPKMDPILRDMCINWATYKWPEKGVR